MNQVDQHSIEYYGMNNSGGGIGRSTKQSEIKKDVECFLAKLTEKEKQEFYKECQEYEQRRKENLYY